MTMIATRSGLTVGGVMLGFLLLFAGVARSVPPQRAPAPRPQSVSGLVDAYLAAWNAHDAGTAAGFLDEHVTYEDANTPATQKGRDSARRVVVEAFLRAAPDCVWRRVGPPILATDGVAFQWVRTGTNTGDWGDGTKATGRAFEIRGMTILRVRDYKILYQGDYYDPAGLKKPAAGK